MRPHPRWSALCAPAGRAQLPLEVNVVTRPPRRWHVLLPRRMRAAIGWSGERRPRRAPPPDLLHNRAVDVRSVQTPSSPRHAGQPGREVVDACVCVCSMLADRQVTRAVLASFVRWYWQRRWWWWWWRQRAPSFARLTDNPNRTKAEDRGAELALSACVTAASAPLCVTHRASGLVQWINHVHTCEFCVDHDGQ